MPDNRNLVIVGRIVKAHGIRGELKVIPETDDPEGLQTLSVVLVGSDPSEVTSYPVKSVRFQSTRKGIIVLFSLEGIETRDEAASLVKSLLFVDEKDLYLADDEYFLHDLIGCTVVTDQDEVVGELEDILEWPAHPVFLVSRSGLPDVMIPAVEAFIEEIDLDARRITVLPIEGLLG